MRYRIMKQPAEVFPYYIQYKAFGRRWRTLVRFNPLDLYGGGYPASFRTLDDAREALRTYLERQKPPVIIEELEE